MIILRKLLFFILLHFSFTTCYAAVTHWQIIPTESTLTFTATQNGAPITGSFKKFSGEIFFDPDNLAESKVNMVVDISSLTSSYKDLTATLMTPDWLNAKLFPKATFTSSKFIKTGDNNYQAQGMLTIRNKTVPVTLNFTQEEKTTDHAKVNGNATLSRTTFGVGQGEWASVDEVKDKVDVHFTLSVMKVAALH